MALVVSEPSVAVSVVFAPDSVWIKNPRDPGDNFRILTETKWQEIEHYKTRSVRRSLDHELPHVSRGVSGGDSFSLTFTILGDSAWESLMDLVDRDITLLVQTPRRHWYVEVSGPVDIQEHLWDRDEESARIITVPFVEVRSDDV